jgi:hypothetical protein
MAGSPAPAVARALRRGPGLAAAALLLLPAASVLAPAAAAVPRAERIADEVASSNRAAGRAEPLLFELSLRIGDSQPVATGVLATHPTGLARLELSSNQGFVERHLLQGNAYKASRDGALLRSPRPFLPPVFLLQAGSGAALRAALSSFGVASDDVALGLDSEHDCYVLGGRLPRAAGAPEVALPSLWVDMDSFAVVRIDRRDGARFRFGPEQSFDGIRAPAWIAIESPGQAPVRLDIERVVHADAPAAAFGTDWLLAPGE